MVFNLRSPQVAVPRNQNVPKALMFQLTPQMDAQWVGWLWWWWWKWWSWVYENGDDDDGDNELENTRTPAKSNDGDDDDDGDGDDDDDDDNDNHDDEGMRKAILELRSRGHSEVQLR